MRWELCSFQRKMWNLLGAQDMQGPSRDVWVWNVIFPVWKECLCSCLWAQSAQDKIAPVSPDASRCCLRLSKSFGSPGLWEKVSVSLSNQSWFLLILLK